MLFDLREIHNESDMHGEPCPVCADRPCVTNIYVTTPDGTTNTRHTCESVAGCVDHTLSLNHHGDDMPVVEISTAPMPWVLATLSAGDLGCVTGSVTHGRVA